MGRIIISDIKTGLRSKRFLIAMGIFIASAAINIAEQLTLFETKLKGGLDLFTFGNVFFITIIRYLAPFIPAFVLGPLIIDGLLSKDYLARKTGLKRYIAARALSSAIIGGGIFAVSYLIILLGCFIIEPSLSAEYYEPSGIFMDIYYTNAALYVFLFIAYTALFGTVYGLFSTGVGLLTKSSWMAMAMPGLVYFGARFLWPYFDNPLLSWMKFLPGNAFNFESPVPLWRQASELGAVLLVSVILVVIGYFKLKRADVKPDCEAGKES